ncbi:MAG: MerR family transcriptional regulator [Lachnospiraceae bacterium]|nr:MerR family transcriptional regulator [Lachnospiraceae bacterium]
MTQQMYSIKEAAQALQVEAHALRYWEEELGLSICRNAQGRRVYTESDIDTFKRIKGWKEQGLQLKAIKELIDKEKADMLHGTQGVEGFGEDMERRIIMYRPKDVADGTREMMKETREMAASPVADVEKLEKAKRLQELLKQFITESIRESNAELLQAMKEGLLKELDYQFRLQEEREAERERVRTEKEDAHFKELDENLRSAMEKRGRKKKKALWGK